MNSDRGVKDCAASRRARPCSASSCCCCKPAASASSRSCCSSAASSSAICTACSDTKSVPWLVGFLMPPAAPRPPPPNAPANIDVGSIKLASPKDAPAPMSSIPVCTPSVTDSTAAPVAPLVATRRVIPPLLAASKRFLPTPKPPNPKVRMSAPASTVPAAKPPATTRPRFTSLSSPPSAIACSPAWPYMPPVDCPTAWPVTPATEPMPPAVTLSPILSPSRSLVLFLIPASAVSLIAFLASAAPIPPEPKAATASGIILLT